MTRPPRLIHYRYKIYQYIPCYQYTVLITRPGPLLCTNLEAQYVPIMRPRGCTDNKTVCYQNHKIHLALMIPDKDFLISKDNEYYEIIL